MEAARTSRRSLGEIFVERGLISDADLERALAEQSATKERLADILVRRGLVTGRDITDALIAQLASFQSPAVSEPSKTDHIWDDGAASDAEPEEQPARILSPVVNFWSETESDDDHKMAESVVSEPDDVPEVPVSVAPDTVAFDPEELMRETEERRAKMESRLAALGPLLKGVDQVQADLAAHDLCTPLLAHELGATQERLVARGDELASEIATLKQRRDDIARNSVLLDELRAELANKVHELAELKSTAAIWNDKVSALEAEVDTLTTRTNQAAHDLNLLAAVSLSSPAAEATTETYGSAGEDDVLPVDTPSTADGHVLFVPNDDGYELIERDGGAPQVGEAVDIGAQEWVVTKVGPSPLPYDDRDCAFLTTAT
jgi:hypothetical protein